LTTISAVQRQVGLRPGRGGAAPSVVWLLRAVGLAWPAAGGGAMSCWSTSGEREGAGRSRPSSISMRWVRRRKAASIPCSSPRRSATPRSQWKH